MSSTIHKITANSESFTPNRRALQSPCGLRRHERGLLAAPTARLLPLSFLPSATHTSPHPCIVSQMRSHVVFLSHAHISSQMQTILSSFTPTAPPHTHLLPIALQINPSLFPQSRRPMPPGPVAHSNLLLARPICSASPSTWVSHQRTFCTSFCRRAAPRPPWAGSFSCLRPGQPH